MDQVAPVGAGERLYALIIWVFSFITGMLLVSTITSDLTQLHAINGARARQVALLQKYLTQNSISKNLALQVQRSAQHAVSGDLTKDMVELLSFVSEPLRIAMHFEMYRPVLERHAFFLEYLNKGPQVMRRICHYGTSTQLFSHGEIVFSKGEAASQTYFVMKGSLEYTPDGGGKPITIRHGQPLAEAVLWTGWHHKGTLTATTDVKMTLLDPDTFQDIAVRHFNQVPGFDPRIYAADFVAHLCSLGDQVNDLSTLHNDKGKGSLSFRG
eukprot:gnl/TRDRNA2_/TRDRNA2_176643_c3_seq1.p1 gnl/TRDRNA2_/TRDRNA2_176643_c3~~gnl/TRDRNA2_/TRDRNA2_176643_c3_seq1.p1  ORF type:complete len:269 (-),score=48.10 gnl/TRDRNA2_/TRDRNA2_176643_c3_seq1:27-833(-)